MTQARCLSMAFPLLVLLAAVAPVAAQETAVPVIISTDTSTGLANGWRAGVSDIDDGLAIAMALDRDELDVRGVVVTWGNNLMEAELAVAERVVTGMGSDVPVIRGAPRALPEYPVTRYDRRSVDDDCLNEGVIFMAAEVTTSSAPVTVVAIGPLTDVACLALNFPDAAARIEKVVAIGGRAPDEAFVVNGVYLSDFNMALDGRALRYLLEETAIPLQFMLFGLTSSVLVPATDRDRLCAATLPLAAGQRKSAGSQSNAAGDAVAKTAFWSHGWKPSSSKVFCHCCSHGRMMRQADWSLRAPEKAPASSGRRGWRGRPGVGERGPNRTKARPA